MKVPGFKAAAVEAGLRYKDRLDLGLIVADEPVAAAGVFTSNLVKAAPVLWSREKIFHGRARAILANSGQANACTGAEGLSAASASAAALARLLDCPVDEILLASTGVIGEQLNLPGLLASLPALTADLSEDGLPRMARAIMTTDTRPKIIETQAQLDGRPFTLAGVAKGSGMICPDMATMLSFLVTDAAVDSGFLQTALKRAVDQSFNRITVDGDTSTNDCVFLLASGQAGNIPIKADDSPGSADFEQALTGIMFDLAKMLVADAEGATKLVKIVVSGAVDDRQAAKAAQTVANSPLVKTAIFGQDANWGRIMGALGRSGASFDPDQVDIYLDEALLVRDGQAAGSPEALKAAEEAMLRPEFSINIDLGAGKGMAEVLTCDLSLDYVKINADYRS